MAQTRYQEYQQIVESMTKSTRRSLQEASPKSGWLVHVQPSDGYDEYTNFFTSQQAAETHYAEDIKTLRFG